MGNDANREVGHRLKNARKNAGLTVEQVAESTGQSVETVRSHEKGARGARNVVLTRYARLYQTTVDKLAGKHGGDPDRLESFKQNATGLVVVGVAQTGVYRARHGDPDQFERIPVQRLPTYPKMYQFAVRVEGKGMDLIYGPGTYAICVGTEGQELRMGDHVLLVRHSGELMELSIREVWQDPTTGAVRYLSRSTMQQHSQPIDPKNEKIGVMGIVIASYYARPRAGRTVQSFGRHIGYATGTPDDQNSTGMGELAKYLGELQLEQNDAED